MLDFNNDLQINEDNIEFYKWKSFFESMLDIILVEWVTQVKFSRKDLCLEFGSKIGIQRELECLSGKDPIEKIEHYKIFYCKVGVTPIFNSLAVNEKDVCDYLTPFELEISSNGLKLIKISQSFINNIVYEHDKRRSIRKKIIKLMKEYDILDYYSYHNQIDGIGI